MTLKIYFGAPLFNEMEQMYNAHVVKQIREKYGDKVDIYLPQENDSINDKSGFADSLAITQGDNDYLEEADLLIAMLDGVTPDSGLSAELGYFYSMNRPILGLYTDVRQGTHGNQEKIEALDDLAESQFSYINLYTVGLVKIRGEMLNSSKALVEKIGEYIR
ncbi:Nucleoside 2-deoxyribosyltransferase [Atopostipes suicloacalis DSM 15692]|uniref:Nucleoside 2-deoxyribosyltransferase n=1 Tax=Atopostipes suicloacalis DSM 15692 TaxID=1121025 RepID=A0A1M4YVY0_9LACT|nr:nucleoside 2-deoxyribosyltransferase [Atopostipes suicloacalis]SHF09984.1 Nucleoside 2-deoxyribosyltransferase [Atopostipes suicloacalis DSM 15692]